ncbi:unnamed protein product [marine sediment metagenome]|uniref:Uncharacterized protein n=1 Tax=marine sediment metagenome TaxID=412755 RepID=X1BLD0_9ZZZZ
MPANGSDFPLDRACGYQDVNEIKNSHRAAIAPTAPEKGLLWEDTGHNLLKVWDAGWNIIQATAGQAKDGMITPWAGGYFADAVNGGYVYVKGTANTIAGANAYLNPLGWYVCDGTEPNQVTSDIWTVAGRYLPNLTDNRFIQGDTLAGTIAGASANNHTHDCNPVSTTSGAESATTEVNYAAATPARAIGHTHDCDIDNKTSSIAR